MEQKYKVIFAYLENNREASAAIPEDQKSKEDLALQTKAVEKLVQDMINRYFPEYKDKVFAVGGFVRDELLGKNPKDLDLVVDDPETKMNAAKIFSKKLADKLGITTSNNPHPLKDTYGIWGLVLFNPKSSSGARQPFVYDGVDITGYILELTPPRREGPYSEEKREPEYVEYTSREDDAKRRDLTVNALYKNIATGDIEDYVGGEKDLKNKTLRPPEHPEGVEAIYREDPLRILRLIRFTGKLGGFKIDPETEVALKKFIESTEGRNLIKNKVSAERIRDEFQQILTHPDGNTAIQGLEQFRNLNLLNIISPDLEKILDLYHDTVYHKGESVWEHTMDVLRKTPGNLKVRLAALFHDIGKMDTMTTREDSEGRSRVHFRGHEDASAKRVEKILRDLKFPTDIITSVKLIVQSHMGFKNYDEMKAKTLTRRVRIFIERLYDDMDDAISLLKADAMDDPVEKRNVDTLEEIIRDMVNKDTQSGILRPADKGMSYIYPLSGNDIMELYSNIKGRALGAVKERLKKMLLEGRFDRMDEINRSEKAKEILKDIASNEQVLDSLIKKQSRGNFY